MEEDAAAASLVDDLQAKLEAKRAEDERAMHINNAYIRPHIKISVAYQVLQDEFERVRDIADTIEMNDAESAEALRRSADCLDNFSCSLRDAVSMPSLTEVLSQEAIQELVETVDDVILQVKEKREEEEREATCRFDTVLMSAPLRPPSQAVGPPTPIERARMGQHELEEDHIASSAAALRERKRHDQARAAEADRLEQERIAAEEAIAEADRLERERIVEKKGRGRSPQKRACRCCKGCRGEGIQRRGM